MIIGGTIMRRYEVNNISISTILANIDSGMIAIPEIQRPFVWKRSKVRDLLDSLYKGYPVGYIITWRNADTRLKDGSVAEGKQIIIDGQQRITALAASLNGKKVLNDQYKYIDIKIAFNPLKEEFQVTDVSHEKSDEWIPDISQLFKNGFPQFKFISEYSAKNNADPDDISNVISTLMGIKDNLLGVIELPANMDIETVTEIFTRINSKGVPLKQQDFAMSKIAANDKYDGPNLRKSIDYFCHLLERPQDYENIRDNDLEFAKTGYLDKIKWIKDQQSVYVPTYNDMLKVIFGYKFKRGRMRDFVALLSGRNFEERTNEEQIVEQSFEKLKEGIFDFLNEHNFKTYLNRLANIGMVRENFIQAKNVLNFGYILFLILKDQGFDSSIRNRVVEQWLVLSNVTKRYSGSSETKIQQDIDLLLETKDPEKFILRVEASELSETFWNVNLIEQLTTTHTPNFYVFLMAQIRENNRGFLSTETVQSMIMNTGDIHHVFPKNYLTSNGKDIKLYNQIGNYVMMQKEMNIKVGNKSPKEYLNKYIENDWNLEENAIPSELADMEIESYNQFLFERRKLMSDKIRSYYESFK